MLILDDICIAKTKGIAAKDVAETGKYPVFGATGLMGYLDTYESENEYVGIIKDGAGVGRTNIYPAKSSLLGTMQYIFPKENIDIKYLMYLLRSLNLGGAAAGAAIPHIYFKNYKKSMVPECDFEKQKLISKLLEKIENLIKLKQKQLFSLDELVKSRFIEMFGQYFEDENNLCKLEEICNATIGLTYKPTNVSSTGTIVLRSGNIQDNELYLQDDIVRVSNIKINDDKYIHENDILMCSRNGSARLVGKSCLITKIQEPMSFGAFMTVIRCEYPYFLQAFFSSDYFKQQLTGTQTASVNQITTKMLYNYVVIKPKKEDENTFAEFVKQVDKSKFIVQKQIEDLQELLDSKMDEYFG